MDSNFYFYQEVIVKYKIDKLLKPKNLGNGALDNVTLSDLYKALELCYAEINHSFTLKEDFLEYLQEYLVDLRAIHITSQKNTLKAIKTKRKKLKKKLSAKYNYHKTVKKIDNYTWQLQQEKYIFHYLEELGFFIRIWLSEKRKEEKEQFLKDWINKNKTKEFINGLMKEKNNKTIKENPYPEVFININSYLVFNEYCETIINDSPTDYSFIYRIMYDKGLIRNSFKQSAYKNWLDSEFQITVEKVKTLDLISMPKRLDKYNMLIHKYKVIATL